MVPERDVVLEVGKRDHTLRVLFGHRKQVLEYVDASFAESRREIVEYEMRIGFGHGASIFDVVSHHYIVQCKVGRRAVRQVAHLERVGLASRLMQYDQIGALVGAARLNELFRLIITAIDALRVGKYELHLFGELFETRAGRVRRRDNDFGIVDARPLVLVVCLAHNAIGARIFPVNVLLDVESLFSEIGRNQPILYSTTTTKRIKNSFKKKFFFLK